MVDGGEGVCSKVGAASSGRDGGLREVVRRVVGRGEPVVHMWALATFWPALNILLGTSGAGFYVWLLAAVYGVFLSYVALHVAHGLADGRARVVALTPLVLGLLFGLC